MYSTISLPLILTLLRLFIAPTVLPLVLIFFLPHADYLHKLYISGFIGLCSLTDFFDGYLARKWGQQTLLGTLLDPIADKFFVCSLSLTLLYLGYIPLVWVLIVINRELAVMGMREIACVYRFRVPVSFYGKIKTTLQMLYIIGVVIGSPDHSGIINLLMVSSAAITFYSGLLYGISFLRQFLVAKNN